LTTRLRLAVLIGVAVVAPASAPADEPARQVTVVAGPEYAAGGFRTFWLGKGYRDVWTTPITVPVLDLETFAGGLRPLRRVGRLQTLGLGFEGKDGLQYTFRSLDKDPERILPVEWRDAFPARIVRDHTSATYPAAALVLPALAGALSLLHTEPRLVVLPDDPALGEFRKDFAGRLGTLDVYADAGPGMPPPFDAATAVIKSNKLWERWLEGPKNGVDERAYLRARMLDLLAGDYDRHSGQWRWVRLAGQPLWQPLREDPDMVFLKSEGLAFDLLRGRAPRFVEFGPKFPKRLEGLTISAAELDRWLLSGLDRAAFAEVARDAQARLTDAVIDEAVRQAPPEWQEASRAALVPALRSRRDALAEVILHYYRDLARLVDVHATDRDDVVTLRRLAGDALEVVVAEAGASEPYFKRVFVPGETREVRVYLHGGNDRFERVGEPGGPIRVRVVAGEGHDTVDDRASGGTEAWPGEGELHVVPGRGTDRHRPWAGPKPDEAKPWVGPRDYGHWTTPYTEVMYASELDLLLGAGFKRTAWGFRSLPEASLQDVSFLWSTGEGEGRLSYSGLFRAPGSRTAIALEGLASGIERINFFGYGNETLKPDTRSDYRTFENVYSLEPSLRLELRDELQLHADAVLRLSDTPTDRDNVLNRVQAYGRGSFTEAGVRAGVHYDSRGVGESLLSGGLFETVAPEGKRLLDTRVEVSTFYLPALLDVEKGFGGVEGEAAGYLGPSSSTLQVAARFGGRRVWGTYPWIESAFIGGRASVRGFSRNRFAGDGSLYGSLEARAWLVTMNVPPIPLRLGVLAFGDVGRVWLSGEASEVWHPSWGGGVMLQPVATPYVITVAWAGSREGSRWYFGYGFFF
jgi:hypothetical protein